MPDPARRQRGGEHRGGDRRERREVGGGRFEEKGVSSPVAAKAPALPSTTPAALIQSVLRSTIHTTAVARAPSAMRTPISWVRCATE